jgi:hypothetical protein
MRRVSGRQLLEEAEALRSLLLQRRSVPTTPRFLNICAPQKFHSYFTRASILSDYFRPLIHSEKVINV